MDSVPEDLRELAIKICGSVDLVPWDKIKQTLDDCKVRNARVHKEIKAKRRRLQKEGAPYKHGLLELCVMSSADYYLFVTNICEASIHSDTKK